MKAFLSSGGQQALSTQGTGEGPLHRARSVNGRTSVQAHSRSTLGSGLPKPPPIRAGWSFARHLILHSPKGEGKAGRAAPIYLSVSSRKPRLATGRPPLIPSW